MYHCLSSSIIFKVFATFLPFKNHAQSFPQKYIDDKEYFEKTCFLLKSEDFFCYILLKFLPQRLFFPTDYKFFLREPNGPLLRNTDPAVYAASFRNLNRRLMSQNNQQRRY